MRGGIESEKGRGGVQGPRWTSHRNRFPIAAAAFFLDFTAFWASAAWVEGSVSIIGGPGVRTGTRPSHLALRIAQAVVGLLQLLHGRRQLQLQLLVLTEACRGSCNRPSHQPGDFSAVSLSAPGRDGGWMPLGKPTLGGELGTFVGKRDLGIQKSAGATPADVVFRCCSLFGREPHAWHMLPSLQQSKPYASSGRSAPAVSKTRCFSAHTLQALHCTMPSSSSCS